MYVNPLEYEKCIFIGVLEDFNRIVAEDAWPELATHYSEDSVLRIYAGGQRNSYYILLVFLKLVKAPLQCWIFVAVVQ